MKLDENIPRKGQLSQGLGLHCSKFQRFTLGFPPLPGYFQEKQQRTTDQCRFYVQAKSKKYTKEPTKVQLQISNVAMEARHISTVAMEAHQ